MYKLSTSLPYLLNRVGVRMGEMFSRRIAGYGLTLPMYRVMAALMEGGDETLGSLARIASVELSTLSRLIGQMVDAGLVTRERLPGNERSVRINLTKQGHSLAHIVSREAQHYEDVATSRMAQADVEHLKSVLAAIFETLDRLEEELCATTLSR